jgi:crotonobetainyl-CoA:carnitine CoA-transferase CaiB-like acyl-CoA transferase
VLSDKPWTPPPADAVRANPLTANYLTKDGHWLALTCLQAGKYWPHVCDAIDQPELAKDPRFADHPSLMANSAPAAEILRDAFAEHTLAEWRLKLANFIGQWAVVQDTLEAAFDPQSIANGYLQDCRSAEGVDFKLVTAPVQFGEVPAPPGRAPTFNEHGDDILTELGLDWDSIVELKVRGVVP